MALILVVYSCAQAAKNAVSVRLAVTPEDGTNSMVTRTENRTDQPVTFCVEFGQTSIHGNIVEATPIPFIVEATYGNGWNPLLIGPDMGSSIRPVVLESGKSADFPFRLKYAGDIRLLLRYWVGAIPDLNCNKPPAGWHQVKSPTVRTGIVYTLY